MPTRLPETAPAAIADLLRSRIRAIVPLGFITLFGLTIYFFFCSINPKVSVPNLAVDRQRKYPNFWVDGLGRTGPASFPFDFNNLTHSQVSHESAKKLKDLMSLPILHRTFKDPFDPRSGFKPVPDAETPWLATSPARVQLANRLSRDRFPPPDSDDPLRGSSPPPRPRWPSRSLLRERKNQLKKPIPQDLIAGLNASDIHQEPPLNEKINFPNVQWSGFKQPNWESNSDRKIRLERQGWVRRGFQHVWEGYKAKAWGHDELKPISGSFEDPFGGWGATLVDSLDTLLIMNLTREYNYARTHVRAIDWAHAINGGASPGSYSQRTVPQPKIRYFETVIRYLGGLLSAYDLSGDKLMLQRAEELASWLLPAFGTTSGLPPSLYQMGSNLAGEPSGRVCLAEIGSLTLEFTRLSQLTSKQIYYDTVQKITDLLDDDAQWSSPSRLGTLFPIFLDPRSTHLLSGQYTFGAMADSYYEYLIKEHQLLHGKNSQYSRMFASAIDSARTHLVKTYELESPGGKNITVIGDETWGMYKPSLQHLTCFSGAMIGLGAKLLDRKQDLDLALEYTDTCVWAYESTKTGVGPEIASVLEGNEQIRWQEVIHEGKPMRELKNDPLPGLTIQDGRYLGRPETIESVYYMWRITGDRQWQERGWRMFTSWMEACLSPFGFADIKHVNALPPGQSDKQESFVLGETFKYYYLLFSDPDFISLDDFVFNTEAHPLRIDSPGKFKRTYWKGPESEIDQMYDPPWLKEGETGFGTFLQQWSRVDTSTISDANHKIFNQVMGFDN